MDGKDQEHGDNLAELTAAIDEWVEGLTELRETLLQMRDHMGPAAFERRFAKGGIDRETLADFLAFDGQLTSDTDRMMAAFLRVTESLSSAVCATL